jgi:hypothetical protein
MDNNRTVKKAFNTKPIRIRKIGRPKLRWEDDVIQDIVTYSGFSIDDGTLLHSKFNTQLLITVSNFSRIRTHVQPLLVL